MCTLQECVDDICNDDFPEARATYLDYLEDEYDLSNSYASELLVLIEEVMSKRLTFSRDLSLYISKNNLGKKYSNISGYLTMKNNKDSWKFEGGFPANIYRAICNELNLLDQGSEAKVIGFRSYNEAL